MLLLCSAAAAAGMSRVKESWGLELNDEMFTMTPKSVEPPLVHCSNFLSPEECDEIVRASCEDPEECTEYLNHVVNTEELRGYDDQQASEALEWSQGASAGMRTRLPRQVLDELVAPRALDLLGLSHRRVRVAEELFYRPNRVFVIVRDATVVRYRKGEGVAPHVDGKDATVLVYLNSLPNGAGGRTVFPEHQLAFQPRSGDCLVYNSKEDLLHFAEPVHSDTDEKWVMQLLIDFQIAPGEENAPVVDWDTGLLIPL